MQSQNHESGFQLGLGPAIPLKPFVPRVGLVNCISATVVSSVMASMAIVPVQAASLTHWNFDSAANRLDLTVKDGTTPRYFLMAQPARIVVDLPDTSVSTLDTQKTYTGAIRQIRVSQFQPGLTRIVMELSPDVSLAPGQVKLEKVSGNSRWILRPLISQGSSATPPVAKKTSPIAKAIAVTPPSPVRSSSQPANENHSAKPIPPIAAPAASTRPIVSKPATTARATVDVPPLAVSAPVNSNSNSKQPSTTASNLPSPRAVVKAPVVNPVQAVTAKSGNPPTEINTTPAATVPVSASGSNLSDPNLSSPGAKDPFPQIPNPIQKSGSTVTVSSLPASNPTSGAAVKPMASAPPSSSVVNEPDKGMAIDTTRGVAISVPSPDGSSSKPVPATPTTSPVIPSENLGSQAANQFKKPQLPSSSLTIPAGASSPPIGKPSSFSPSSQDNSSSWDIPSTIAAAPSTSKPTIIVPLLDASEPVSASAPANAPNSTSTRAPASPPKAFPPPESAGGLPSTTTGEEQPVAVSVPSLSANQSSQTGTPATGADENYTPLPPGLANSSLSAVSVPQITSTASQSTSSSVSAGASRSSAGVRSDELKPENQPSVAPARSQTVEFGQPLPTGSGQPTNTSSLQSYRSLSPDMLVPAGTLLELRYPGEKALSLATNGPQQEVLLLQTEIRDPSGNVIVPEGTRVIGRFETTSAGSRFVTQGITFGGRTLPISAQSDNLGGNRDISGNAMALNTGIGVLAGSLLGGLTGSQNTGWGALGGAAAGAATTYLTSPKPATIQPGQTIQVRLQQDLRQP